MQSVSSRIWTRVAVFISYDDNHYTTGTITRGISPKVNAKVRLEFELVNYDDAVQYVNYNTTVNLP